MTISDFNSSNNASSVSFLYKKLLNFKHDFLEQTSWICRLRNFATRSNRHRSSKQPASNPNQTAAAPIYLDIDKQQEEIEGIQLRQEVNQLRHASVLTDNQDENLKHLHRVWIYRCRWIDHVNLLRQVKQMKVNLNVCW